jgi:hypothetical protein
LIKIGLGKALGFSLLTFIGLNFLFIIIAATFSEAGLEPLFTDISNDPLVIITILFAPIIYMPGTVITEIYTFGPIDASLIGTIGFLVSPFVAALVAGLTGESKKGSFLGWMITALIGSAALGVLASVSPSTLLNVGMSVTDPIMLLIMSVTDPIMSLIMSLIGFMLNGAVYGIFYGCFALLFTKTEMY